MPRMESKGYIEASGRTLLGMRVVGGYTFCCEFTLPSSLGLRLTGVRFGLSYNMLKNRKSEEGAELTSARTLLYAAEASQSSPFSSGSRRLFNNMFSGAVTSILTNPIWVVKIRMFTTHPNDPTAYRNLWRTSPLPFSIPWL